MGLFKKREERSKRNAATERRQAFSQVVTNFRLAGAAGGNYDDDNQRFFDAVVRYVRDEQAFDAGIDTTSLYYDIKGAAHALQTMARGYNPDILWPDCLGLLWDLRSVHGDQVPDPVAEHSEDVLRRRPTPSTPSGKALVQACGLEIPDELPEAEQEAVLQDLIQRMEAGEPPSSVANDLRGLDRWSPHRRAMFKQAVDRFLGRA